MFFFLTYKIGDWSFNTFCNNEVDRLSRKQCFKVKTCPNNISTENVPDGHIIILRNRKKVCCKYNIMDFP